MMDSNDDLVKKGVIEQFNRLGSIDKNRLPRYYSIVKDLPISALKEIVDEFLDSSRQVPLPKDFLNAASEWRKRFYSTNGFYFGSDVKSDSEAEIECKYCFDTGVLKVKHHTPDSFKQLMRCDCIRGELCPDKLPRFSNDVRSVFVKDKIDETWFNPQIQETDTDVKMYSKIWSKVKDWRKSVMQSEKYWRDLGYLK